MPPFKPYISCLLNLVFCRVFIIFSDKRRFPLIEPPFATIANSFPSDRPFPNPMKDELGTILNSGLLEYVVGWKKILVWFYSASSVEKKKRCLIRNVPSATPVNLCRFLHFCLLLQNLPRPTLPIWDLEPPHPKSIPVVNRHSIVIKRTKRF